MNSIFYLLSLFFRVALLKTPPQDLPSTSETLYTGILLALAISLVRYFAIDIESYPISRVVLEVAVPGLIIYALLMFCRRTLRFGQTYAAMCGSAAVIHALAIPVLSAYYSSESETAYNLSVYLIIAFNIWQILVMAFIIRHAMDVGFASGISLAIATGLLSLFLVEWLAPISLVAAGGNFDANP